MAWAALLAAVAAVAPYAGTPGHGFVLDDGPEVVENAFVRSLADAPRVLGSASWAGAGIGSEVPMWRPLTTLTYSLDYAAGGLDPRWFHVVNLALHGLASALVVLLAWRLGVPPPGALAAGLLFAVMPVHVEAVANVAGRKELLVTLLAVATLLAHRAALRRGGAWLLLPPLLAAAALLAKESGLAVPAIAAAHDAILGREAVRARPRRAALLYAGYAAAVAAFLAGRQAVLGTLVFPTATFLDNPVAGAPAWVRAMTAVAVVGRGLLLLVAPATLSPDYSYAAIPPVTSPLDPAFLASLAAATALSTLAWRGRRAFPMALFAVAWYGLALFPASNLVVPIGTIFGERLLYLPSVGAALAAGAGVAWLLRTRAARRVAAATVALVLAGGLRTFAYAAHWESNLSLFDAAVAAQPASAKARRMLGGELMEAGRAAEARAQLERAVAILERSPEARVELPQPLVELAVAWERSGDLLAAERQLQRALALDPSHPDALWRLGVVRWQQGRRDEAVGLWRGAVASNARHAQALSDLGIAASLAGDLDGAEAMWRRAVEASPGLASAWYRLGDLRERRGDAAGARQAWLRFLDAAHDRYPEMRAEVARKLGTSDRPR